MSGEPKTWTDSANRWLGVAAVVVAPTSLITGMCYFFGLLSIRKRLEHFGVDPSTLNYTNAEYVSSTIGVFFFALLRVLLVCAVAVLLAVAIRHWAHSDRAPRLYRGVAYGVLVLGVVVFGNAAVWLVSNKLPVHALIESADAMYTAGSIVLGAALLIAGYWMLAIGSGDGGRRFPVGAERALLVVAVASMVGGLFWVTDIFAVNTGKGQAEDKENELWSSGTSVELDTTDVLDIPSTLVKVSGVGAAQPGPATYRYQCLRVLEARGGRYVLVPANWSPEFGYAITVTPDNIHHITSRTIAGMAAGTGDAANVRRYWQCPEVVHFYEEGELDAMLIGPDVAQHILAGRTLTAGRVDNAMPAKAAVTPDGCAAAPNRDQATATRMSEMTGDSSAVPLTARQRVTRFASPASAQEYVIAVQQHWAHCAGQDVDVAGRAGIQHRTLGAPGVLDDIQAVSDSAPGSTDADCTQAVGAKSNVVIESDACGPQHQALAVGLVAAIRDRIPTRVQ